LNDDLSGVERAVRFDLKETGKDAVVVHSLAKWKRMALATYGFSAGEGLYTDMNAIRRDEEMDNLHSVYTDQWDWEKIITRETRNLDYLKKVVQGIVGAICDTLDFLKCRYPQISVDLTRTVSFITAQELEDLYPNLTSKERENAYLKEHKTAFIMQIGGNLKSGKPHDNRAPDYDDWSLNGDILFWNEVLGGAIEISSMGIRVDEKALDEQLEKSGANDRRKLPFHQALLAGKLPLTIGGGIGQSRLSMLLLGKAHIGEVQVSLWDEQTKRVCKEHGIVLL
jgi:aspartate--ammonia ligase